MQIDDYHVRAEREDYRYTQRIVVPIRWVVLASWFALANYRTDLGDMLLVLDLMAVPLVAMNGYMHWRLWAGRPITAKYVYAMSILDLTMVTAGIAMTTAFDNTFFVFYYPVLAGFATVFPSRWTTFALAGVAIGTYLAVSLALEPGVDFAAREERILIARAVSMFGVVVAASLITSVERSRRIAAVRSESRQVAENLELQQKALRAEMAAQQERARLAREIHDGIAQEVYMLGLGLETSLELLDRDPDVVRERLEGLVPAAKHALLHTRNYLYDLKPLMEGQETLPAMAANQVREFRTIAGIPAQLKVEGDGDGTPVETATGLYRILQESLANVVKHAHAAHVNVTLSFEAGAVTMVVEDDGTGFDVERVRRGHGLNNMEHRAAELGGTHTITPREGGGTRVTVTVPGEEG